MKIYVVGGAIRDQLLGLPVKDLDYVVVGATTEQMLAQGYTPVGQDFPVFLHPVTHAEYALARTERKVSPGYKGFVFHADSGVTLEQDLARRDLTINAMAKEADVNGQPVGDVIDPYGGQKDINNKLFRHIGPAFSEDPVRLLRIARFAARFSDFSIAPSTLTLLKEIHSSGELNALVKERVWQEISRGLMSEKPSRMLEVLVEMGVFELFFPKMNSNNSSLLGDIDLAANHQLNLSQRCAVLLSSLNVEDINAWAALWGIPVECRDHAVLVRGDRVARPCSSPGQAGCAQCSVAGICVESRCPIELAPALGAVRLRPSRRHWGRGNLPRHGAFWAQANCIRMVRCADDRTAAELLRAVGLASRKQTNRSQCLLRHRAFLLAYPTGDLGNAGQCRSFYITFIHCLQRF